MKKVENQKSIKATMYKWSGEERVGRCGDLIYRNERKERKGRNTYLG